MTKDPSPNVQPKLEQRFFSIGKQTRSEVRKSRKTFQPPLEADLETNASDSCKGDKVGGSP